MSIKTEKFQAETESKQKTEDLYVRYEERGEEALLFCLSQNF